MQLCITYSNRNMTSPSTDGAPAGMLPIIAGAAGSN